eukprot:3191361-Rhodomonas_salina.6
MPVPQCAQSVPDTSSEARRQTPVRYRHTPSQYHEARRQIPVMSRIPYMGTEAGGSTRIIAFAW